MSNVLEKLLSFHNWMYSVPKVKQSLQKNGSSIRLGILSAAAINFIAIIDPIQTHPDVKLTAIAARSLSKAEAQITKYALKDVKAYGSYDELLSDSTIDVVYIPLPNGLHAEWTIRAMKAGKHVLIEKPIASNAEQAKQIREVAKSTKKIAMEAYHWRFYPAAHRVKELVDSGEYGAIQNIDAKLTFPSGFIPPDDIRFNYDLAGGSSMDLAYVYSAILYYASSSSTSPQTTQFNVLEAKPRHPKGKPKIDEAMQTSFSITSGSTGAQINCTTTADLAIPKFLGIIPPYWRSAQDVTIDLEKAKIQYSSFVGPWLTHKIIVTEKGGNGKGRVEKVSRDGPVWGKKGEEWWTTYRYQLEAFVERVKKANNDDFGVISSHDGPWMTLDESVQIMELVDAVYDKAQMPRR